MIREAVALLIGVVLTSAVAQSLNSKDVTVYRDKAAGFILSYQKSWLKVPSTHERTRIKIVSENGFGGEDCAVNVGVDERLRGLSAAGVSHVLRDTDTLMSALRSSLPDAKLVEERPTFLSNREAMLRIIAATHGSPVGSIPIKMVMVQTIKGANVYTVSCRASPEDFERHLPVFMLTFAGFLLSP